MKEVIEFLTIITTLIFGRRPSVIIEKPIIVEEKKVEQTTWYDSIKGNFLVGWPSYSNIMIVSSLMMVGLTTYFITNRRRSHMETRMNNMDAKFDQVIQLLNNKTPNFVCSNVNSNTASTETVKNANMETVIATDKEVKASKKIEPILEEEDEYPVSSTPNQSMSTVCRKEPKAGILKHKAPTEEPIKHDTYHYKNTPINTF